MPEPAYPAYAVNESEYETEPVQVVTVNKPNGGPDGGVTKKITDNVDSRSSYSGENARNITDG